MKVLGGYLAVGVIFTGIYFLLFHLPVLSGQKILFYRGLSLLIVAMGIMGAIGEIMRRKKWISGEILLAAIITAAALNLAVFVIFPVSFDRSVSMYLLNKLSSKEALTMCGGLPESELEIKLITEYIQKDRAVRRRIEEQKATGTVTENNGCVELTTGGRGFLAVSEIIKKVYAVK
jgi:hypothetical protein